MSALRRVVLAWTLSRLVVLAAAASGYALFGLPERGVDPSVPRWLSLLGGWDTTWYLDIARHGYEQDIGQVGSAFSNLAFFPLLPAVMRAGDALGLNPFVVGLVASNAAFLVALWLVERIGVRVVGATTAARGTWALAFVPTSAVASLAYTDGLVLALAAGAALASLRGRWWLAGLLAAVAALARPTGILAMVVPALVAVSAVGGVAARAKRLARACVPALAGIAAFLAWMQVRRGSWTLPFDAQRAWERGGFVTGLVTDLPDELAGAWRRVSELDFTANWLATVRDLAALAAVVWLAVRLARRVGRASPWVALSVAALALPLASGSVASLARFSILAFPIVWPLGDIVAASRRRRAFVGAAIIATVLFVWLLEVRAP